MKTIQEAQFEVHKNSQDHGWYEGVDLSKPSTFLPEKLMLIVSEVSEALEEYRNGKPNLYFNGDKPEGMGPELADVVIRVLDLAEALGINMQEMIQLKHDFNVKRPYRHGGKRC